MPRITRKSRRADRTLSDDEQNLITLVAVVLRDNIQLLRLHKADSSADRFERAQKLIEELRELHS